MHKAYSDALVHESPIRVLVVARSQLESESFAALLATDADFHVLSATTSTEHALKTCRFDPPHVVLCDAKFVDGHEWPNVAALVRLEEAVPVLLLDDEVNHSRLSAALEMPAMGYFTRGAAFCELADGMRRLAKGERAFETALGDRLKETPHGWKVLRKRSRSPLSKLTPRETEIFRLIAMGNSVRQCAEILAIAPSTVDNHKGRMMKKLGMHKLQDLVKLAIRVGLIRI